MNIKELLAKRKGLIAKLKAADSKEALDELTAALDEIDAQIEVCREKAKILDGMESNEPTGGEGDGDDPDGEEGKKYRSLGAKAASEIKSVDAHSSFTVHVGAVKAVGDPAKRPEVYMPAITEVRPDVLEGPRRQLTVVDLFAQETTDKAAITYFVEGPVTGAPGVVAEGGKYPQLEIGDPVPHTDPVKKIGCLYKETEELLEDAPRLAQSIDNRANYLQDLEVENQVVSGDGKGDNLKGLLNTSGLQLGSYTDIEGLIEAIKSAKVGIKVNTPGFRADGLVINDEDWDAITSQKDANKQYLAGGPFYGAYGSDNGPVEEPPLWGLRVVPTQAVPKGTCIVGAFYLGGSVIKKDGRVVDITNSDVDDFEHGRIAIRPSERMTLAVRYPAAFVKISLAEAEADDKTNQQ